MNTHADKTKENKSQSVARELFQKQTGSESVFQFVDNRPEAIAQRKLQEIANNSPQVQQAAQLQAMADNYSAHQQQPIQKKENNTGLPDNLKSGIENLSGYSMDDVKVHRNSDKPAQLQAHAYAQGTDIHLGTGQEKHLPHEAWHVVQQKQGRVKPTTQLKNNVNINDDAGLEKEADLMGRKSLQLKSKMHTNNEVMNETQLNLKQPQTQSENLASIQCKSEVIQLVTPLRNDVLNVVGEEHPETAAREDREKQYTAAHSGSANYWTEARFRTRAFSIWKDSVIDFRDTADPFELRFNHSQKILAENAIIIQSEGNANTNTVAALDNLNSQKKFIHNLWTYLVNLDARFWEERTDGFEVPSARRTEMLGYKQQIKNIAVTWQAARVALAAAIPTAVPPNVFGWANDGGVAITSEANERANHKKSIDDLGLLNIVARTAAQLSQDRSAAMHVAANTRSVEIGVWKVGDAHAGHMTTMNPKAYNLVRRADFNADYNTWNP